MCNDNKENISDYHVMPGFNRLNPPHTGSCWVKPRSNWNPVVIPPTVSLEAFKLLPLVIMQANSGLVWWRTPLWITDQRQDLWFCMWCGDIYSVCFSALSFFNQYSPRWRCLWPRLCVAQLVGCHICDLKLTGSNLWVGWVVLLLGHWSKAINTQLLLGLGGLVFSESQMLLLIKRLQDVEIEVSPKCPAPA